MNIQTTIIQQLKEMLRKLPGVITKKARRFTTLHFYLISTKINNRFYFTSQSQPQNNPKKESQESQRLKKQQEIEFRKRTMQDIELKNIRARTQNTKGNYNPTFAYLKLYSNHFLVAIIFGCLCIFVTVLVTVGGVYQDPLTNKKKILLISEKFEKSIDKVLRDIMLTQLCGTLTPNDTLSSSLKQKSEEIETFIKQKTSRNYKITLVSSQQHIINILPSSIVISKNIFSLSQCQLEDLKKFIILMQRLFSKKTHIKQLALQNIPVFVMARIKRNTMTDLKLASIYSRKYDQAQLKTSVKEVSFLYKYSQQQLKQSIEKVFKALDNQILYKEESKFSILNRFSFLKSKSNQ